jgi:hypothetical protein
MALDYIISVGHKHPNSLFDRAICSFVYSGGDDFKKYLEAIDFTDLADKYRDAIGEKIRTCSNIFTLWGFEDKVEYIEKFADDNNIFLPLRNIPTAKGDVSFDADTIRKIKTKLTPNDYSALTVLLERARKQDGRYF